MKHGREFHQHAAALQEKHAAAQELHAEHARQLGMTEMALVADGRAIVARQRAKRQRQLAADYELRSATRRRRPLLGRYGQRLPPSDFRCVADTLTVRCQECGVELPATALTRGSSSRTTTSR
jgi:hypothetical protein